MVYVKTNWRELSMTTQNKLDGLNNLETLNTQSDVYTLAVSHTTRYHGFAEAESTYYYTGHQGAGSGAVCETLDTFTAAEIIDRGIAPGMIAVWSGLLTAIPTGWYLCDGNIHNGILSPDLRNKFVVGAGTHYNIGSEGGANTVTLTATATVASHILTAAEIPKHTHSTIVDTYPVFTTNFGNSPGSIIPVTVVGDVNRNTGSTGGNGGHTHPATWTGATDQTKLPLYYALCYIMRA
jgi:microcystin-dependent protein